MWLSTVDRFLHHDSGEKERIRKEKRPRMRVQENAECLEPESLSHRFPLVHPPQPDPVQPGHCSLCLQRGAECVHKFLGVYILHMETACVLCALKDRGSLKIRRLNALCHSQSSQAEPGKHPAAADNRSEIVERCKGNKGVLRDGEHRGDQSSVIYPKCGPALEKKRPQAAQIKEEQIKAWGFCSAHVGQAGRHCKELRSSVHSRAHDLTGPKAVSDPWSVLHQTAQDNF